MGSSNQIGVPQDSRNIASDLIQAPESLGLTTIDQVNSQTDFGSTPFENYAFLDGTDILPKLPSIPLLPIPDLSPKNIPEFIDGVRQWLRDPQRPQCQYGYHELCCQVGAPNPSMGLPGRDPIEVSKRRRKCARCMREIRSFLIFPLPPPNHRPACRSNTRVFFRVEKSTGMLFSRRRLLLLLHGRGTYNSHRLRLSIQRFKYWR